jgi:hypothetical protein
VGVLNDSPATRHVLDEENEKIASARVPGDAPDPTTPSLLNAFHMFAHSASHLSAPGDAKVVPTCTSSDTAAVAMAGAQAGEDELDLERNAVARSVKAFFVSGGAMSESEK